MGTGSSKEEPPVERPKDVQIIINTKVADQIRQLNEYVKNFNEGDTEALLRVVDSYGKSINKFLPNTSVKGIKEYVAKFHGELRQELEKEFPGETQDQIKTRLLAKLKDEKLVNYLETKNDLKMAQIKKEIDSNLVFTNNIPAKKNVDNIFSNINKMKAKYRYFEYKYVRMNLFMVVFIQHVFTTMNNFIVAIVEFVYREQNERHTALVALVKQLLALIDNSDVSISTDDFGRIDMLMDAVQKQLSGAQDRLNKAVDSAKERAVDEITKLLSTEENLASVDSFKKFEEADLSSAPKLIQQPQPQQQPSASFYSAASASAPASSLTSASPGVFQSSAPIETSPPSTGPGPGVGGAKNRQKGGFVRDHSRFPQSFYDLT